MYNTRNINIENDTNTHIEMIRQLKRVEYHFDNETCATRFFVGVRAELFERGLLDDYTIQLHTYKTISVWVWIKNDTTEIPPYVS